MFKPRVANAGHGQQQLAGQESGVVHVLALAELCGGVNSARLFLIFL
jgi:hypothetical protein